MEINRRWTQKNAEGWPQKKRGSVPVHPHLRKPYFFLIFSASAPINGSVSSGRTIRLPAITVASGVLPCTFRRTFRLPAVAELPQCFAVHMIARLFSAALRGVEAQEVEVNACGADKPVIIIVGKTLQVRGTAVNERKSSPCSPIPTPVFPRRSRSRDMD